MRDIKFRAWNGNQILDDQEVKRILYNLSTGSTLTPKHYPVMQFTGLIDKNGKEIYLNDIIRSNSGDVMLVIWRDDLASFSLRKEGWAYDHYFGEAVDAGHTEIIGNIHENPELL